MSLPLTDQYHWLRGQFAFADWRYQLHQNLQVQDDQHPLRQDKQMIMNPVHPGQ